MSRAAPLLGVVNVCKTNNTSSDTHLVLPHPDFSPISPYGASTTSGGIQPPDSMTKSYAIGDHFRWQDVTIRSIRYFLAEVDKDIEEIADYQFFVLAIQYPTIRAADVPTGLDLDSTWPLIVFVRDQNAYVRRPSPTLQEPGRGTHGDLHLAGRLVQPAPAPLGPRLLVTDQLREEDVIKSCLGPKP